MRAAVAWIRWLAIPSLFFSFLLFCDGWLPPQVIDSPIVVGKKWFNAGPRSSSGGRIKAEGKYIYYSDRTGEGSVDLYDVAELGDVLKVVLVGPLRLLPPRKGSEITWWRPIEVSRQGRVVWKTKGSYPLGNYQFTLLLLPLLSFLPFRRPFVYLIFFALYGEVIIMFFWIEVLIAWLGVGAGAWIGYF